MSLYSCFGSSISIYDLLFSDSLSKGDIDKIKKLSVELLRRFDEMMQE